MSGIVKGIGKVAGMLPIPGSQYIGAGLGALGGILGRGKEDPRYTAQTNQLDQMQALGPPQTAGVDPMSQEAFGLFKNLATNGPNVDQFYNKFEPQVIGNMQRDISGARTSALNAANDAATRSGAFGGSRSGIMGATALGEVNKAGLNNLADFRYKGYQDAVSNAMQQQQFGLQAANAMAGAGDYNRNVTQAGYDAPFNRLQAQGQMTAQQLATGHGYQARPSILQSALGGALTGFGLFKNKPGQNIANNSDMLNQWLQKPPQVVR